MPIDRVAWLVTVFACLVLAVLLLFSGYQGYAAISVAVGVAAATNLRRRGAPGSRTPNGPGGSGGPGAS